MPEPIHLGDGVYAAFDGYSIELRVNDHRSPVVVVLEPSVLKALCRYGVECHMLPPSPAVTAAA